MTSDLVPPDAPLTPAYIRLAMEHDGCLRNPQVRQLFGKYARKLLENKSDQLDQLVDYDSLRGLQKWLAHLLSSDADWRRLADQDTPEWLGNFLGLAPDEHDVVHVATPVETALDLFLTTELEAMLSAEVGLNQTARSLYLDRQLTWDQLFRCQPSLCFPEPPKHLRQ